MCIYIYIVIIIISYICGNPLDASVPYWKNKISIIIIIIITIIIVIVSIMAIVIIIIIIVIVVVIIITVIVTIIIIIIVAFTADLVLTASRQGRVFITGGCSGRGCSVWG